MTKENIYIHQAIALGWQREYTGLSQPIIKAHILGKTFLLQGFPKYRNKASCAMGGPYTCISTNSIETDVLNTE